MGSAYDWSGRTFDTYSRISEDHDDTQTGVTNQRRANRELIEKSGGKVGVEHVENDTGAFKKRRVTVVDDITKVERTAYRVVRPVWAAALQRLRDGEADGLVVYDLDRLARDPRDLEDAIEIVENYKKWIVSSTATETDLSTTNGVMMARFMVIMANKSSADTSRRVTFAAKGRALAGRPGGGVRPFGWAENKIDLHPVESALVREAARALMLGETNANRIARAWGDRGVTTTKGNRWTDLTVRQYFKHPRLCGHTVWWPESESKAKPHVLTDSQGLPVVGEWEPLLTVEEFERIQPAITTKAARPGQQIFQKSERGYLLSGFLRCGTCGGKMYGNPMKGHPSHYYRCTLATSGVGKHTVAVNGTHMDAFITDLVKGYYASDKAQVTAHAEPKEWAEQEQLDLQRRLHEEALEAWRAGALPGPVAFAEMDRLKRLIGKLERERERYVSTLPTGLQIPAVSVVEQWDDRPNRWRRAAIERVLTGVVVNPLGSGMARNRFEPKRLRVEWR